MSDYSSTIDQLKAKATELHANLCLQEADQLKNLIIDSIPNAVALKELYKVVNGKKYRNDNFEELVRHATIDFERMDVENPEQGIYVFIFNGEVVYLGITRQLYNRLKAHAFSVEKNKSNLISILNKEKFQSETSMDTRTKEELKEASEFIRENFRFLFIPIENYTKKYWLEVTLANKFQAALNSFKTH